MLQKPWFRRLLQPLIELRPREHKLRAAAFSLFDLDINPMTLKLEDDLDTLKMQLHSKHEVARLTFETTDGGLDMHGKFKKCENSSQGQRTRSNATNFQTLLAFTVVYIPTKLHQLPISSF